jgi:hypothetical protein
MSIMGAPRLRIPWISGHVDTDREAFRPFFFFPALWQWRCDTVRKPRLEGGARSGKVKACPKVGAMHREFTLLASCLGFSLLCHLALFRSKLPGSIGTTAPRSVSTSRCQVQKGAQDRCRDSAVSMNTDSPSDRKRAEESSLQQTSLKILPIDSFCGREAMAV